MKREGVPHWGIYSAQYGEFIPPRVRKLKPPLTPDQSTVAPYLEAITFSRAKKEYGSMPKQVVPWNKAFGGKVEDA